MSKEARLNLVFLVALLLLSLPGVILLISKHLKPGARRLADPPYVRRTEAYNNPLPASTASIRVVPPITSEWVARLAVDRTGSPPLRHEAAGGRWDPVISEGRRFELLSLRAENESVTVVLLGWLGELGRGEVQELVGEAPALGTLESVEVERLEVPSQVVKELQELGYVVPPSRVGLVWLRFAPPPTQGDARLQIAWRGGGAEAHDVLDLRRLLPVSRDSDKDMTAGQKPAEGEDQ